MMRTPIFKVLSGRLSATTLGQMSNGSDEVRAQTVFVAGVEEHCLRRAWLTFKPLSNLFLVAIGYQLRDIRLYQ